MQSRFAFDDINRRTFEAFHAANPAIYALLRRFALEAKRAGRQRIGISALFERVRWYTDVESHGSSFKLNNSMKPHYSRLLMAQEPELAGIFETRHAMADVA